ncbi:MAG TPA: carotenoid oxygenase family protein [Pyrinomonadaceae bacterium]|nr:carotenoid oxygenase family protein [Pyrinomonadaceae bacterium]
MEDYAPLIERAFSLTPCEQSYVVEDIDGEVPEFVRGTYYLNGPARFSRGGLNYRHWLDGDGMVYALRFENGSVRFTNRFVRGRKFVAEEEAGRPVFRTFGTGFKNDRLKRGIALESPVNVTVYPYQNSVLAFGEQGLPWELDPVTLETRGEYDFGGALNDISPFAAHPKFDAVTGEMFNFGIAYSAVNPHLNLYRFGAGGELIYRKRLPLPYACSIHDFSLSWNYVVFYLSPYVLNIESLGRDDRTLMEALTWEPERGSRLLIVSRATGEQVTTIPIGHRYCLHLINCFEEANRLIADVLELEHPIYDQYQVVPDLFTDVCEGQPVRFVIDVDDRELANTAEIDYLLAPDFPSVAPRQLTKPYRDFWMLGISATGRRGRKFFDQLVHANWTCAKACDVYQAPAMHYLGAEPVLIADPGCETAGVVICQIFDAERASSSFAIFDAFKVAAGPIAVLPLTEPIALGFHASFNPRER